jgi:hypothetical protein
MLQEDSKQIQQGAHAQLRVNSRTTLVQVLETVVLPLTGII